MDITHLLGSAKQQALLEIADRCKKDLFYLCKYILDYKDLTEDTHKDLCNYTESLLNSSIQGVVVAEEEEGHKLADSFDPRKKFLLLLMPRGTFKSSVVTIGFSLQAILNDPNTRILIDSETFSKSKAFLAEIKGHLEGNEKFREVYKALFATYPDEKKRDDLWTDSQVNISARRLRRKEPTFSCAGIDVTKTGMHYDLIIMDDLMSEKNVTTKEQIDQVVTHYKLALALLDPGKYLIVIGTRWDYNDVYQHILDNERDRFNVLVRKARQDNTLFFPERLTEEYLDSQRKSLGSYLFSCQYMNEPVDNESATFKVSTLVRVPWEEVKDRPMNWYLSVDPSFEGPYSDYAAFVVAGMDYMRQIYVKHVLRAKMTYSDIINNIFRLYTDPELKINRIILETVATQKSLQYELVNEQKRRGLWLPVIEVRGQRKAKEERIRGLAPLYEFGHIFHIRECPQLADLEYELIHFPRGTHDDVIDALATVLEIATPPTGKAGGERREKKKKMLDLLTKPRSPITGV